MPRIPLDTLHRFATDALGTCGVRSDDAEAGADALCFADARGFPTHGVNALATIFVPALREGRIDAAAQPEVVAERGAALTIDGRRALGLATARRATDLAVERAREHGAGVVAVRNSTHCGCLSYYTHRAARAGAVAIAATNCGAQGVVPPLGGATKLLGTNPISAAVPAASEDPFVLDMSTTAVAAGKVKAALARGDSVPEGWLVRGDGTPTTDPSDYVDGAANLSWLGGGLATGGAKGYGLGVLVDLLCGPLAGSAFGAHPEALAAAPPDDDIGHVVIAIDPAALGDRDAFLAGADALLGTLLGCPPADGAGGVTYAGRPEAEREREAAEAGAEVGDEVLERLRALAGELGLDSYPEPAGE